MEIDLGERFGANLHLSSMGIRSSAVNVMAVVFALIAIATVAHGTVTTNNSEQLFGAFVSMIPPVLSLIAANLAGREQAKDLEATHRKQTKELTDSHEKTITKVLDYISGGNTWPIMAGDIESKMGVVRLTTFGDCPLYDVELRITNLDLPVGDNSCAMNLGNFIPRISKPVLEWVAGEDKESYRWLFVTVARNGAWRQWLTFKRIDGKWTSATFTECLSGRYYQLPNIGSVVGFPRRADGLPDIDFQLEDGSRIIPDTMDGLGS